MNVIDCVGNVLFNGANIALVFVECECEWNCLGRKDERARCEFGDVKDWTFAFWMLNNVIAASTAFIEGFISCRDWGRYLCVNQSN